MLYAARIDRLEKVSGLGFGPGGGIPHPIFENAFLGSNVLLCT
jgi:hypothetical protein